MADGQANTIPPIVPKTTPHICTLDASPIGKQPRQILLDYLATQPNLPTGFTSQLQITRQQTIYIPCWHIEGSYTANWQAEFGWYPYISCCGQPGNGTFMWSTRSGTDSSTYTLNIPAVDTIPDHIRTIIADTPLTQTAETTQPSRSERWQDIPEHPFDDIQTALQQSGNAQLAAYITTQVKRFAEGDNQKDWHWQIQTITCQATSVWIPISQTTFSYQGDLYTLTVNMVDCLKKYCDPLPTVTPTTAQKMMRNLLSVFSK